MQHQGSKYFWWIQFISWGIVALMNFVIQKGVGAPFTSAILNVCLLFFGGLFFTTLLRFYLKKRNWTVWSFSTIALNLIFITILVSIVWTFIAFFLFNLVGHKIVFSVPAFLASAIPLGMTFMVWFLFYIGYHLLWRFHSNKIENLRLETEIQKAQLGTLKSQLNPHFMFNTLNNIKALVLEDKHAARKMITHFSELLSYSLQHSEKKEVPLEEELEILHKYLELVKIQYEEKLSYRIHVQDGLEHEKIPPMILQLLAENAVKHGIAQSINGGEILIDIRKQIGLLNIRIKNTGSLKKKNTLEQTLGIGLKNIRDRLKLIYKDKASIFIKEEAPFVIVELNI